MASAIVSGPVSKLACFFFDRVSSVKGNNLIFHEGLKMTAALRLLNRKLYGYLINVYIRSQVSFPAGSEIIA